MAFFMETARRSAKGGKNMRVKKLTAIGLSVVCAAGMLRGCGS